MRSNAVWKKRRNLEVLAVDEVVLFGGLLRLGASTHADVTRRPTAEV